MLWFTGNVGSGETSTHSSKCESFLENVASGFEMIANHDLI